MTWARLFLRSRSTLAITVIVVVALLVRLAFALAVPRAFPTEGDAVQYEGIALSIVEGRGFAFAGEATALRPPVYPAFVAGVYRVFGRSLLALRVIQALIDSLTIVMVFLVASRLFDRRTGLLAGAIVALHPGLAFFTTELLTETVFTFLLVLGFYLFIRAQFDNGRGWAMAAGLAIGLAALCRPTALLLPFALSPAVFWARRPRRSAYLLALTAAVTVGTVIPWTARNALRFGEFTPISTSSFGAAMWYGSYPPWDLDFRGWGEPPLDSLLEGLELPSDAKEIERVLLREAVGNIVQHPRVFVWFAVRKAGRLWRPPPGTVEQAFGSRTLLFVLRGHHVVLLILFGMGLLGRFRAHGDTWIVLLLIYWTGIHALTVAVPRFLVPLVPILAVYAATGALHLLEAGKAIARRPSAMPVPARGSAEPIARGDQLGQQRSE